MPTATLTSKGQITIPQPVRQQLGLRTGDRIDFIIDSNGRVVLKSRRIPFEHLRGMVKTAKRKAINIREMDEAIAETAAGRFLRVARGSWTAK